MYRTREGRQRRFTIGRHGAWTPDTAREEARRLLGEIVRGADPAAAKREAREAMTVAELCDAYLADAEAGRLLTRRGQSKKASTLAIDRELPDRSRDRRLVAIGDRSAGGCADLSGARPHRPLPALRLLPGDAALYGNEFQGLVRRAGYQVAEEQTEPVRPVTQCRSMDDRGCLRRGHEGVVGFGAHPSARVYGAKLRPPSVSTS
jgi:Arm DNA-binding domain